MLDLYHALSGKSNVINCFWKMINQFLKMLKLFPIKSTRNAKGKQVCMMIFKSFLYPIILVIHLRLCLSHLLLNTAPHTKEYASPCKSPIQTAQATLICWDCGALSESKEQLINHIQKNKCPHKFKDIGCKLVCDNRRKKEEEEASTDLVKGWQLNE